MFPNGGLLCSPQVRRFEHCEVRADHPKGQQWSLILLCLLFPPLGQSTFLRGLDIQDMLPEDLYHYSSLHRECALVHAGRFRQALQGTGNAWHHFTKVAPSDCLVSKGASQTLTQHQHLGTHGVFHHQVTVPTCTAMVISLVLWQKWANRGIRESQET